MRKPSILSKTRILDGVFDATVFFTAPIFLLVCLIPDKYRPRLVAMDGGRIGHITPQAWIYGTRKKLGLLKHPTFFFVSHRKICNTAIYAIVKREIGDNRVAEMLYHCYSRIPRLHRYCSSICSENEIRDIDAITARVNYNPFSQQENDIGRRWLKKHGWNGKDKIICLLSRDNAYLRDVHHVDGSKHSYRNSRISSYVPALQWLLQTEDVFIIRMGSCAEERLNIPGCSNYIDYPFLADKSDLLDIWLFVQCDFFITSGSGQDIAAAYCNKPGAAVNYMPLETAFSYSRVLHSSKVLRWKDSGLKLTLEEQFLNSFSDTGSYEKAGIEIEDLTENQILTTVMTAWNAYFYGEPIPLNISKSTSRFKQLASSSSAHKTIRQDFYVCEH